MKKNYKVTIRNKKTGEIFQETVSNEEYILKQFEKKGLDLPFSCRNGCCTSCAVKIISGKVHQPEAMGISKALRRKGYALLCVAYASDDLDVLTQDEDEVYELQFGRFFGKGNTRIAPPWELEED